MSTSAAHAAVFFTEAVREGRVWTLRDEHGFPAPVGTDGNRAMPFWSLRSRVEGVIAQSPAYASFHPEPITLDDWQMNWLPGLERDGLNVGLNWSGPRATGYDVPASSIYERIRFALAALSKDPRWALLDVAERQILAAYEPHGVVRVDFVAAWPHLTGVEPWLITESDAAADAVRGHPRLAEHITTLLRTAGFHDEDLDGLRVMTQSQETVDRDYEGKWFLAMR